MGPAMAGCNNCKRERRPLIGARKVDLARGIERMGSRTSTCHGGADLRRHRAARMVSSSSPEYWLLAAAASAVSEQ